MLDISITNRHSRWCNGMSRRNFIRVGALAPLGLSLPQLMVTMGPHWIGPGWVTCIYKMECLMVSAFSQKGL